MYGELTIMYNGCTIRIFHATSLQEVEQEAVYALPEVQGRARVRLLTPEMIREAFEKVEGPWGHVKASGGDVCNSYRASAETTVLHIWWFRWRRKLHVHVTLDRSWADHVPYGREAYVERLKETKKTIWKHMFPERAAQYERRLREFRERHMRWTLADLGVQAPDDIEKIVNVRPELRCALVQYTHFRDLKIRYLCTPLGYCEVNSSIRSVRAALKAKGIDVPRKATWDDIKEAVAFAVLEGGFDG